MFLLMSAHSPQINWMRLRATDHSPIRTTCNRATSACDQAGGQPFRGCLVLAITGTRYTSKPFGLQNVRFLLLRPLPSQAPSQVEGRLSTRRSEALFDSL